MDIQAIVARIELATERRVRWAFIAHAAGIARVYSVAGERAMRSLVTLDGRCHAVDERYVFAHEAIQCMMQDALDGMEFYKYIPIDERSCV